MSNETSEWLNQNTLIGFTATDGNAWHWDGISNNQYEGAIPLEDIEELFNRFRVEFLTPTFNPHENSTEFQPDMVRVSDEGFRAVARVHGDSVDVYNYVKGSYEIHQYNEWLLENVANLIDASAGDLKYGSAIVLKNGAVAAVQVRPTDMVMVGGDQMLPYILATTSHDSTIATTYKGCYGRVVCDNTLDMAMREVSSNYRVKHTKNSKLLVAEARQALDIIYTGMDEFQKEVERLMNTPLTTAQYADTINYMWPQPEEQLDDDGNVTNKRALNNWHRRFDEMWSLWRDDPRVGDYQGTMWGGVMAHNTWAQWSASERDSSSQTVADVKQRQIMGVQSGDIASEDRKFIAAMVAAVS